MELTQFRYNTKSNAFVNMYGNIFRKCTKCNKFKDHEFFNGTDCKKCKYISEKTKGGELYLQRKNKAVKKHRSLKNANKPTKEQREKLFYDKHDGKHCKVYFLKCIITGNLFTSKTYYKRPINTNQKGDYKTILCLVNAIKTRGRNHNCSQCNNDIDLTKNGKCYSHTLVFCSKECTQIHVKETKHNRKHLRRKRKSVNSERVSRKKVFTSDDYNCYLCGIKVVQYKTPIEMQTKDNAATIDHVVALANGGSHTYNNIRTCCRKCNSKKRDL